MPLEELDLQSLQEENEKLRRAIEELSILNDLARTIGASMNIQEIIQTIVRRSLRAVNAEQGVISLVEKESEESMKTLVRTAVTSRQHEQFHFHQILIGWMHLNKKPLVINNTSTDERFRGVDLGDAIHSLLAVPMMVKSHLTGVLTVYNKKKGASFSDSDQRLLAIIASQSAQVVETARLYEMERELLQVQGEVRLASRIQMELLPKVSPSIPGYEIIGKTIPAQEVGGDYFDFIPIDERRIALCLGDVSGKGLPASLLMANLQATLRGQTLLQVPPKECLIRSNTLLFKSTSPEKFATLFYGILDSQRHQLHFSNAGHDNPLLFSEGKQAVPLTCGGIPLGMLGDSNYEQESIPLQPGDTLVIYSDGVPEAMNEEEDFFGLERLTALLHRHAMLSVQELIEKIFEEVRIYAGKASQADDVTIMVVRRSDK